MHASVLIVGLDHGLILVKFLTPSIKWYYIIIDNNKYYFFFGDPEIFYHMLPMHTYHCIDFTGVPYL